PVAALCLITSLATALPAQGPTTAPSKPKPETQAQLQREEKVSLGDATATAQKAVPSGKITGHELEREKGKLIWSFDIKTVGKAGTEEVNIDAMTGAVIDRHHESPADEAREAKQD